MKNNTKQTPLDNGFPFYIIDEQFVVSLQTSTNSNLNNNPNKNKNTINLLYCY